MRFEYVCSAAVSPFSLALSIRLYAFMIRCASVGSDGLTSAMAQCPQCNLAQDNGECVVQQVQHVSLRSRLARSVTALTPEGAGEVGPRWCLDAARHQLTMRGGVVSVRCAASRGLWLRGNLHTNYLSAA